MSVLFVLSQLLALLQHTGHVAGQFTAAPPTCPGNTFTFTCTVTGDRNGITIWRVGGSNDCILPHSTASPPVPCGSVIAFTVATGNGFGTTATSFSSTLSGKATPTLNDTLVSCFGPDLARDDRNIVGNSKLHVFGSPSVSTLSCVDLFRDVSGAMTVILSWTLSGGDSADFHLMTITTNAPQTPYGGLLNITNGSVKHHELTGFMTGYEYNISIRAVNCGSQEGMESETLTITPQVPAVTSSCNLTLLYNWSSRRLKTIDITWDSVPDLGEACSGQIRDITQYRITLQTESFKNVSIASCTTGRCTHTFELPSNPPLSYDSVSVAAENMAGVGAARNCTTQPISTSNILLTGKVIGESSPSDTAIICIFLSGFTGHAKCTVRYGTDPSYMNLPYSAESIETGTIRKSVRVMLKEQLNSSTDYYYTVSAVSGDVTVTVLGTFSTPQFSCSPRELWNLLPSVAKFIPDVSLLNDAAQYPSCDNQSVGSAVLEDTPLKIATVAYYTGTTAGSTVCFVCNNDSSYVLNATINKRVCQSDGAWSGDPITCGCTLPLWIVFLILLGLIAVVAAIIQMVTIGIRCYRTLELQDVIVAICSAIGIAFLIVVGVMVVKFSSTYACDSSWQSTFDGLSISGFVVSFLVIFGASAYVIQQGLVNTQT